MSNTIKGFRGADGPILLDFSGVGNVPGAVKSIAELHAEVGDFFEVESVDAENKVATVKAVSKPGGDSGENVSYRPPRLMDGSYNVLAINHRGYSIEAPENTIPAYIMSKENGYNYAEADVAFTADGVPVLLHDATIDRTSDGSGTISEMSYADVMQYDFGSWKSETYAGTKIATFEEFIRLCKNIGLHPYIELKRSDAYTQVQIRSLVEMVHAYGMEGRATWISFNSLFLSYIKAADPYARLGYLVSSVTADTINTATGLRTGVNEVFVDSSDYDDDAVALCQAAGLPLEIWTVNTQSIIESMPAYVTGVTSDNLIAGKILHDLSMTYTPPALEQIPATGITLDKTAITFSSAAPQTITATVTPDGSTDIVQWESSDPNVATVADGTVTPLANGDATITATAGEVSAECQVTVQISGYGITRHLVGCVSNSSVDSVSKGAAHAETFTAEDGYTLDGAAVAVTMGGLDISDMYDNGVLSIDSVTGDIAITIFAAEDIELELTHNWDFTESMTDSVGGAVAVARNANEVDETIRTDRGLEFVNGDQTVELGRFYEHNIVVELDIAEMNLVNNAAVAHQRVLCIGDTYQWVQTGFMFRKTGVWTFYTDEWDTAEADVGANVFSGKTLRAVLDSAGLMRVYADNELIVASTGSFDNTAGVKTNICIGSYAIPTNSDTFCNMTITAARIYKIVGA